MTKKAKKNKNSLNPMDIITEIANKDLEEDDVSEEDILFQQVKNIFFHKFGEANETKKVWKDIENKIKTIKPDGYQEFIHILSQLPFTDEEFGEFIIPLQQYWSYKNLTPKERDLQQTLVEMLQLFTDQEGGADLIKKGKDIGKIFEKRMKNENESLFGRKPIDILKNIDPNFKIDGSDIQGTFI